MQPRVPTPEEVWSRYDRMELQLSAPLSERMLDLAELKEGMQVLDLATGRGEPAIRAAHRVGPSGQVVGVDISASMLQMAKERATSEGLSNLELITSDAQTLEQVSKTDFDVVLARWCLMYFQSPLAAIVAARKRLRTGGLMVAVVWADPARVSYHSLPRQILSVHSPQPEVDFGVPGVFYYAHIDKLARDFENAGFAVTHTEEMQLPVMEADTAEEVVAWTKAFGMAKLLNPLSDEIQKTWELDMIVASERLRKNGLIQLGGTSHILVARAQ